MKKYKPCCDLKCLNGRCETRENGGCYCLCRMIDRESSLLLALEGALSRKEGYSIYVPGRYIEVSQDEKNKLTKELYQLREKIKKYEIAVSDQEIPIAENPPTS